ncbi:MAG: DUF1697 domain-containing protein [Pseudomonadota bacterium]
MTKQIALLRGVNVGGNRMVAMADLKAMLEACGFTEVKTVLQSGNVIFRSETLKGPELEAFLDAETLRRLGLASRYIVRDAGKWRAIVAANPFTGDARDTPSRVLVTVGRAPFTKDALDAVRAALLPHEKLEADGRTLYAVFGEGMGQSKAAEVLNRAAARVVATGRNWNTVLKLAEAAGA